ncbi:MAG: hypothetical protein SNH67_05995, partial [Rikenellaceae bacterium]
SSDFESLLRSALNPKIHLFKLHATSVACHMPNCTVALLHRLKVSLSHCLFWGHWDTSLL